MIKAGMSKSLARHFAFVLNHNPAVLYADSIKGKESNFYIVEFFSGQLNAKKRDFLHC